MPALARSISRMSHDEIMSSGLKGLGGLCFIGTISIIIAVGILSRTVYHNRFGTADAIVQSADCTNVCAENCNWNCNLTVTYNCKNKSYTEDILAISGEQYIRGEMYTIDIDVHSCMPVGMITPLGLILICAIGGLMLLIFVFFVALSIYTCNHVNEDEINEKTPLYDLSQ